MKDLISVIVPVYNTEKYLPKCIESIINQTYTNLEIILVDDGTPDNAGKICDEYTKKDKRIKVINKENGGLSDARNCGLDIAEGEYISFVDSDDYIADDMIEILYNRIISDNTDMAICNLRYVDENYSDIAETNNNMPVKDEILSKEECLNKLIGNRYWYFVTSTNRLYSRKLFNNLRFIKGKLNEDEFIAHHVIDKCENISCVEKPLYFYVQRPGSIMTNDFNIKRLDGAEALLDRTKYALNMGMYNLMSVSFNISICIIDEGYNKLKNDKQAVNRIKELKKEYNKIFFKVISKKISLKKKITFSLFFINIRLYDLLLKCLRK